MLFVQYSVSCDNTWVTSLREHWMSMVVILVTEGDSVANTGSLQIILQLKNYFLGIWARGNSESKAKESTSRENLAKKDSELNFLAEAKE